MMSILDERIEKAKNICIIGHQNPDGDCIGATLATYNYICNKYKDKVVKPYLEEFSKKYMILDNADKIKDDANNAEIFDLCILVDISSEERFKTFNRYFKEAKETIVIDHHETNNIPANVSIVYEDAIATCEILYNFFDEEYIDETVAKCLYVGIATDSGVFRYKATSKKTFEIVGQLISYGFDFTKILDTIVFDNTVNQRKAQGIAFDRLKLLAKGQVSFSYLDSNDLLKLNLQKIDIDNVIVYLREISDIKVAAFAYEVGNNIFKFSLRSKYDNINVATFATNHDGGGHMLAAGCMYYGDIKTVEEHFAKDISDYIETCFSKK